MENLDVKIQRILEQRRQEELEREAAEQELDEAYEEVDSGAETVVPGAGFEPAAEPDPESGPSDPLAEVAPQ